MDRLIWTPDVGLPDGARARDWLREQRRREQYRWRKIRDPRVERHCITPPTQQQYLESTWNAGGASKALSPTWLTGDVLVAFSLSATTEAPGAPANVTGVTWGTAKQSNTAANTCAGWVYATVATADGTSVSISVSTAESSHHWGWGLWVWRGSDGLGNSTKDVTTAKTVAYTPAQADSGIIWCAADWDANAVTNNNITPTPTNTRQRVNDGSNYTIYVADLTDQTSAGSVSYGLSGAGTTGALTKFVMEVKGAASSLTAAQESGIFDQQRSGQMVGLQYR